MNTERYKAELHDATSTMTSLADKWNDYRLTVHCTRRLPTFTEWTPDFIRLVAFNSTAETAGSQLYWWRSYFNYRVVEYRPETQTILHFHHVTANVQTKLFRIPQIKQKTSVSIRESCPVVELDAYFTIKLSKWTGQLSTLQNMRAAAMKSIYSK